MSWTDCFTPAEKRLALLLFTLTLIGGALKGGRRVHPDVAAWLERPAETGAGPGKTEVHSSAAVAGDDPPPAYAPEPALAAAPDSPESVLAVDPNTAPVAALTRLPGIGPALARRIVEERETVGRFRSPDDLTRVRGIGAATLAKIRPFLRVSP